jgi:excisionase family DNA binding protein
LGGISCLPKGDSVGMPDLNEFMTVQEAAERLGFHVNHVRRMRRQGDLAGVKVGATWLITKESIQKYIEKTAGLEKFDPRRGNQE